MAINQETLNSFLALREEENKLCPRCGKDCGNMVHAMSGNPYSSWYRLCTPCGDKKDAFGQPDWTAFFYTGSEVHYQIKVGNSGHSDWIIKPRSEVGFIKVMLT